MELTFLGTGAGLPSKARNVTSVALKFTDRHSRVWLFDCGEATQHQILHTPITLHKMNRLFVTHLHGDHIYGLPGLLSSRSFQGAPTDLYIHSPGALRAFVETALSTSKTYIPYPIHYQDVENGVIVEEPDVSVRCLELNHVIPSYGFRIQESDRPGTLRTRVLSELGVPPGPIYGKLKAGETVTLDDGRVLYGPGFLGPPTKGRIVTILGDTSPCESAVELARNADVLVHEATFSDNESTIAQEYGHSTARQAAEIAKEANASCLIITHVSARYQGDERNLLEQAQSIFPNTLLAHDFWSYAVPSATSKLHVT